MTYYIGKTPNNQQVDRFFYGMKRDDESGFLILDKVNLDKSVDNLEIVDLSKVTGELQQFENLQEGVDFFDGRGVDHELQYDGLNYEQFKWSGDNLYYYIDEEGQLSVRVNAPYNYSEGITSLAKPGDILKVDPTDLGTVYYANPLENNTILDLGKVSDPETTVLAIDEGSIV